MTSEQHGEAHDSLSQSQGSNGAPSRPLEQPLVILGARVIDGSGADPIERGALVIEGERITTVGHRDALQIPRGAVVVEADGMSVLPGLIDCHVHLASEAGLFTDL